VCLLAGVHEAKPARFRGPLTLVQTVFVGLLFLGA
jgi:hypothetical protein